MDKFDIHLGAAGLASLKHPDDPHQTEFIAKNQSLGHVGVRYRMPQSDWREFHTVSVPGEHQRLLDSSANPLHWLKVYNPSGWDDYFADLQFQERFRVQDSALYWTLHWRNLTHKPLELGDVVLPLPFNTEPRWDKEVMYHKRVTPHTFISGHGSFLFWMRPGGEGPFLVMTPVQECPLFESNRNERNFTPAQMEYIDREGVYLHSKNTGARAAEKGGNWRQKHTSITLSPKYSPNDELTYMFKFQWAEDYQEVREILYREGLVDVQAVPGMTVPVDLQAKLSLRTRHNNLSVEPEYPNLTRIRRTRKDASGHQFYEVTFQRLGENKLTLSFGKNQQMILEFFVTQPLETLFKKRSRFLVNKQQHRDTSKWYNGLFSEWNMKSHELLSPENTDGIHRYVLSCDDPGLCKAPYIAGKNIHYPDPEEVEAVEYYIQNFVWGGLQRTNQEKWPYGIYGIPDWKTNREAGPTEREGWTGHIWRTFDYPHVIHLYWNMYRIARTYPHLVSCLDAGGYLQRAYGTALAYYTYPEKLADWPAWELGNYDELVIEDLIGGLEDRGWDKKADTLRAHWENKIEHFIQERPNLFHSEYPFDPTGFESYQAFAGYAHSILQQGGSQTLEVTRKATRDFMDDQIRMNIATRGWLENSYWQLGSEGDLRYMSQMGGWALMDYALYHAENPYPYLRLGYASFLSSWALMNAGTPESNYGYWYPGQANDGAAGSAFMTEALGTTWLGKQQPRGAWYYGAEIDLGYGSALRTAATIVTDDPLFGPMALGGELLPSPKTWKIIPRDGLRKRLHIISKEDRLHVKLHRDGFAKNEPIHISRDFKNMTFRIENRTGDQHPTTLTLKGLPPGKYTLSKGEKAESFSVQTKPVSLKLSIPAQKFQSIRIEPVNPS